METKSLMKNLSLLKSLFYQKFPALYSDAKNILVMLTPIILGLIIGVQLMMAAFLLIGLHPRSRSLELLTDIGKYWFRPEYDIGIYITGCFVTLALMVILSIVGQQYLLQTTTI